MEYTKLKVFNGILYYRKEYGYYDIVIIGKMPTMGYWNLSIEDNGNITEEFLKEIQNKEKYSTYGVSGDDWEDVFKMVDGTKLDLEYIMSIPDQN